MQPSKLITQCLDTLSDESNYIFSLKNLRPILPDLSDKAFTAVINRLARTGYLTRVSRSIYIVTRVAPKDGLLLFHTASVLRATEFNYVSLETILSRASIISQIPINHITIMSSGRSNIISCGYFGTIEFIHTRRSPNSLAKELTYNYDYRMWEASVALALKDMRITGRGEDLIDWELANELI